MPWYPSTDGRFVTSFWDGQQWRITLTHDHLLLGADCIALDDIAEVAYWNNSIFALPGAHFGPRRPYIYRGFSVIDSQGHAHAIDLGNSMMRDVAENEMAWRGLVDISHRFIEPRIAHRILGWLRAGQEYSLSGRWCFVTLSSRGFTGRLLRSRAYPWPAFSRVSMDPYSNNMSMRMSGNDGKVWLYARAAAKPHPRTVTTLKTALPNAVVLATLMPMAAAEFTQASPSG